MKLLLQIEAKHKHKLLHLSACGSTSRKVVASYLAAPSDSQQCVLAEMLECFRMFRDEIRRRELPFVLSIWTILTIWSAVQNAEDEVKIGLCACETYHGTWMEEHAGLET